MTNKLVFFVGLVGAFLCLGGCRASPGVDGIDAGTDPADGAAQNDAFVCQVIPPTACPQPALRYPDIAPIVQERCVPCHYGMVDGPWPLLTYNHLADWYDVTAVFVGNCAMPPPDAGVPITTEERAALLTWLRCGFPE